MFDAFYNRQPVVTEGLLSALSQTVPLSKTMGEEVEELRRWAAGRARPATSPEQVSRDERRLEL